jgi:hypothetical protein
VEHRAISTVTSIVVAAATALILRFWETSSAKTPDSATNVGDQMTAIYGPEPTPPPLDSDRTYDQAEQEFIADVKRLAQFHVLEAWGILPNGTRWLKCSCTKGPRTDSIFWKHITESLTAERGPTDQKKKR